jgi:8-oxo-dGTP diphosphatase
VIIEVAAAVIQRPDGSFLLAQRPKGKVYAGYWEFPGGKVEPGESPRHALDRELHEELGIDVERAYPWITREYVYPHGHVRLHFFRVVSWRSEPHPREEQAITWNPNVSPMLPANAPVLAALALPVEYSITDSARFGLSTVQARLERGLRLLQIREPAEKAEFTKQVIELAHRHGCKVLTKTRFAGADGLHFTARELMSLKERPENLLAAASCHTRAELERAMALELDFAVLGPVKEKGDRAPLGWARFGEIARHCTIPVYAIGGMRRADLEDAWTAGAHGVAMIRGGWT